MSHIQDININIGTPMQLAFESVRFRLKSEFIGMIANSLLIVRMPPSKSLPNASKIYTQGTNSIIRFVHQGIAYGFFTKIVRALYSPAKLLFLDYPENIEVYQLRNHERVLCLLPVTIKLSPDNTIAGHVTDISKQGCQFSVENKNVDNSQVLPSKDDSIFILLQLPGFENTISIECCVQNINSTQDLVKVGLKFIALTDDARDRLYDFLESVGVE